jgi:hypothetical protein
VCALIIYGATAIQYTPFSPIDDHILALENALHIPFLPLVIWTKQHPLLNSFLAHIYDLLDLEMIALPLYALALKQYQSLHHYFFLVLITACMGMAFYYFFPTTGPASHFPSAYFSPVQRATGIKFIEIHHHQQPSTALGGMIAMPSFHVIWAWLNVYLIRFQRSLFVLFTIINLLLTCACVLLGWHYVLDIIGSFVILMIAFYIMNQSKSFYRAADYPFIDA